jgi:hypothetical protein
MPEVTTVRQTANKKLGLISCTWQSFCTCSSLCSQMIGKTCYAMRGVCRYTTNRLSKNKSADPLTVNKEHADQITALAYSLRRIDAPKKMRLNVSGDSRWPDISGEANACKTFALRTGAKVFTYTHWITTPRSKWGKYVSVLASIDCADRFGNPKSRAEIQTQVKQAKRSRYKGFALALPEQDVVDTPGIYRHKATGLKVLNCRHDLNPTITCRECDLCEESTMQRGGYQAIAFVQKHAKREAI